MAKSFIGCVAAASSSQPGQPGRRHFQRACSRSSQLQPAENEAAEARAWNAGCQGAKAEGRVDEGRADEASELRARLCKEKEQKEELGDGSATAVDKKGGLLGEEDEDKKHKKEEEVERVGSSRASATLPKVAS